VKHAREGSLGNPSTQTASWREGRVGARAGCLSPAGRMVHHRGPVALAARNAGRLCGESNTGGRRNGKPRRVEPICSPLPMVLGAEAVQNPLGKILRGEEDFSEDLRRPKRKLLESFRAGKLAAQVAPKQVLEVCRVSWGSPLPFGSQAYSTFPQSPPSRRVMS
jgi:hypothetical protein